MTSPDRRPGRRRKRRIAILGGGQAGLTAALQLTDPRNPAAADLEVTVHQIGWRLGGKGATGRPKDTPWAADRIEEHGLHNWFGFYDNSFRQIQDVYAELDRPPDAPLATWEAAFQGADEAVFVEHIEGRPRLWTVHNLSNDATPGQGGLALSPWAYAEMALEVIERLLERSPVADVGRGHGLLADLQARLAGLAEGRRLDLAGMGLRSGAELLASARTLARQAAVGGAEPHPVALAVHDAHAAAAPDHRAHLDLPAPLRGLEHLGFKALAWVLHVFLGLLWDAVRDGIETAARDDERRLWIGANLGCSTILGAMADGVVDDGFDVVNDQDFRAWLGRFLHDDGGVTMRSPLIEAIYTASFAYPAGDARTPPGASWPPAENMEAGTALRGMVRTAFTYKGSFAYRFAAGTADTCYAPTYEVLRRRGVRFRFFHRVTGLEVGEGGRIERIHVARQARIRPGPARAVSGARGPAGTPGDPLDYDPLIDRDGLPCWPSTPKWELLVGGDAFRAMDADFESPAPEVRAREVGQVLRRGSAFDEVVLAISQAGLPAVAGDVISASPAWQASIANVVTVRTQAFQAWLTETATGLGFDVPRHPIVTWLYDGLSPLNVLGDYSELIGAEHWPAGQEPAFLGYFTSTMPDDGADPFEPFPDQAAADARVEANAVELLQRGVGAILPGAEGPHGFRWDLLSDPRPRPATGSGRLAAQFFRANVSPTERYVLSVVGSSRHRLPATDPAFPNLFLAGDWTACTLNAGCMEAATISGMLCASAMTGYPARDEIVGVDF
jgi:uncharacterized protein with NAD-binding domain and iron-sulfur cluster